MRRQDPLTNRQHELLRLVAAGDDLATADNGAKRSTRALHDRGLVVIHRSPWRAIVTDVGRYYLEHGTYPDTSPPVDGPEGSATRASSGRLPAGGDAASTPDGSTSEPAKRPPPHTSARIAAERRAAALELIDELVESGPKIIEGPDEAARAAWRRIVDYAKRNHLVPAGKRLEKVTVDWDDLQISLVDGPHANSRAISEPAVPMPTELRDLHPVVKAIEADSGRLHMHESLRHRGLLYFHGLVSEAVRRGHSVRELAIGDRYRGRITTYGRPGVPDYSLRHGELAIVVRDYSYTVTVDQEHPEAEEMERFDQLVVTVRGPGQAHGCRYRWYDRKRSTIDDSIAPVLREIERWAAEAGRIQADRQALWQAAMDEATRLATHDRLVAELDQQVTGWQRNQALRQYCDALEARIREADDDEPVDEARRWLAWAREHVQLMDPLFQLPVSPAPDLRPEELEPYLDGWSPEGPDVFVSRWRGARWQL